MINYIRQSGRQPTALEAAQAAMNGQAPKLDNAIRHYLGQVTFGSVYPVKSYTLDQAVEVVEKTLQRMT